MNPNFVIKQILFYFILFGKMPVIPATQETGGLYLKARPCKVNRRTYLENKLENEKGCWCGEFVQHSIKCPILKKKRKKKHSAKNK
jgi:hypothetical protein